MNETLFRLLAWAAANVREVPAGSNAGEYVESIQRFAGGVKGDSWCCEFVWTIGKLAALASGTTWPLPRTGSCELLHQWAIKNKKLVSAPRKGDVYLLLNDKGLAHHTGFVTAFHLESFDEISGNTTQKSGSSEGWGVFANSRSYDPHRYVFVSTQP
jgi:hypothetical protein